MIRHIGFTGN